MSENYQAFLDERCEKLGTNDNVNSFNIRSFLEQTVVERANDYPAGHINAKLIDFSEICQKKSSEISCFLLIVSWRSFPLKFPVKSADFSKNLPLKLLQKLTLFFL